MCVLMLAAFTRLHTATTRRAQETHNAFLMVDFDIISAYLCDLNLFDFFFVCVSCCALALELQKVHTHTHIQWELSSENALQVCAYMNI